MKPSLFKSIVCASILVFAIGCGKDNKSGKSNGYVNQYPNLYNQYPNLYNQGLNQNQQTVLAKLTSWFNSPTEGTRVLGPVTIKKIRYVTNSSQNCIQKEFLGIPYQHCTYDNAAPQGTEVSSTPKVLVSDSQIINAKGNVGLNEIFAGSVGTLISATDLTSTVSRLDFLNQTGEIVSYIIDTSFHSALNPISKTVTSSTRKVEIRTSVQGILY